MVEKEKTDFDDKIKEVISEVYDKAYKNGYKKGREDGWDEAREMFNIDNNTHEQ